jgi:S1-C subfamily serine protease
MTRSVAVVVLVALVSLVGAFVLGKEIGLLDRGPSDAYRVHAEVATEAARALKDGAASDTRSPADAAPPPVAARDDSTLGSIASPRRGDPSAKGVAVRVAERLKPSVVTIQCSLPGGRRSGGTGVVVTSNGAILTNNHVVEGAVEVVVELSSYDIYQARLIGSDPLTDLALLSIDVPGDPLVPAVFGDSDDLLVGEDVVAVGNALDFGWTVTRGIVSSLHRSNLATGRQDQYTDYIQTDAAINPGNSGGPLANLRGEVVGINVAVLAGRADGIGFAIPSNDARFVADQLLKGGAVIRGYLGIESGGRGRGSRGFRDLSNSERRALGPGVVGGAMVTRVLPGTPAAQAGFLEDDFIYALEGRPVEDYEALRNRVARYAPGTTVDVSVRRAGRDVTITTRVGRRRD